MTRLDDSIQFEEVSVYRARRNLLFGLLCLLITQSGTGYTGSLDEEYREAASRIIGAALTDTEAWEKLTHLTIRIGARLSGSENLERAVQWAADRMRAEGLENVRLQPVRVPHWVRGNEEATVLVPVRKPISLLGLGGSVGTPPGGITAPVVSVRDFDDLEKLGKQGVAGKIVLFAVEWEGYGRTVQYRSSGASRAAKLGAAAVLVRSATGRSLYTPHTGGLRYEDGVPQIPAAAITVEDSEWLRKLIELGHEVRIQLKMEARMLPDRDSANVIGELAGSAQPEEIVVLGGHIDSWDVGQGAHDDGGGVVATWHAVTLLKRLVLRPRRTVRVVLWTNEENGLRGALAYRAEVGSKIRDHVAAVEMDGGVERPTGFGLGLTGIPEDDPRYDSALRKLREIGKLLEGIEANSMTAGGGGADIGPLMRDGVPGLGLRTVGEHYFDWHHTHADTLDKVDPINLRRAVAMLAVTVYILADMPGRLAEEP